MGPRIETGFAERLTNVLHLDVADVLNVVWAARPMIEQLGLQRMVCKGKE